MTPTTTSSLPATGGVTPAIVQQTATGEFVNPFGGTVADQKSAQILVEDFNANLPKPTDVTQPQPQQQPKADEAAAPAPEKPADIQQPDLTSAIDDAEITSVQSQFDAMRKKADDMSASIIDSIKAKYEVRKQQMAELNKRYLGSQTILGETSGRSRYAPEVQLGILSSEERAGVMRLAELDAEENMQIMQAQQAREEKDFDMLYKSMSMVQGLRNEKTKLLQQQYENALRFDDQMIKRQKFDKENVKDTLDIINSTAGSDFVASPEMIKSVDSVLGAGFTQAYWNTAQKAATAKTEKDQIDAVGDIVTILSKIPVGQKISIAGSEYEGLDTPDPKTNTYSETDRFGNVTYITVDKKTGQIIGKASGGKIGKGSAGTGGSGSGVGVSSSTAKQLQSSVGADGFMNTALYQQAFNEAQLSGAKAVANFLKQFPPSVNLNPADTTAKKFFQSESAALKSTVEDPDAQLLKDVLGIE